jgi:hypothetical protein
MKIFKVIRNIEFNINLINKLKNLKKEHLKNENKLKSQRIINMI